MTTWNAIDAQPRDKHGRVARTKRQREVVDVIRRLTKQMGYPPTIRELADELGLRGPNAVKNHLNPLRRKGWVTWQDGKFRTLRVVGE